MTGKLDRDFYDVVVDETNALEPDLIVITGDILEKEKCLPWIEPTLGRLRAQYGKYFILGNHELKLRNISPLREALCEAGLVKYGAGIDAAGCSRTEVATKGDEPSSSLAEVVPGPHYALRWIEQDSPTPNPQSQIPNPTPPPSASSSPTPPTSSPGPAHWLSCSPAQSWWANSPALSGHLVRAQPLWLALRQRTLLRIADAAARHPRHFAEQPLIPAGLPELPLLVLRVRVGWDQTHSARRPTMIGKP